MHLLVIVSVNWVLVQPIVNKYPVVTECGHTRLAATVEYSSLILYEGCTPDKEAQIYWKSWSSSYSWLLHCSPYMKQYYSECYNRDIQLHNLKNYIIKIEFTIRGRKYSSFTVIHNNRSWFIYFQDARMYTY